MKLGVDIGGTKCAVVLGDEHGFVEKRRWETTTCEETIDRIMEEIRAFVGRFDAIGISCGGPLDAKRGVILSPPNLPGWDNVPIKAILETEFSVPVSLCNDADACAMAEWRYGAGKGTQNMVFLTFGTGMGAGIIVNGRPYHGACGNAGEIGHIRMEKDGPVGYRKAGSFEGFCSGAGLAQLGKAAAKEALKNGTAPTYCPTENDLDPITAKTIADAAYAGDETALAVFRLCGEKLGVGLSVLIDILNPERIVIGSIFARAEDLLRPSMERVIDKEALPDSAACCRIVPAALGEEIGDYAALSVAFGIDQ